MKKVIVFSFVLLGCFSLQCFAGKGNELPKGFTLEELIRRGRPNGRSPHLLGHYSDLICQGDTEQKRNVRGDKPLLLTRGTTFYLPKTSGKDEQD